jgi:hypothetical protein
MERFTVVGLDIGQRRDYSALAIIEVIPERTGEVIHLDHEPPFGTCQRCRPQLEDVFYVRDIGRLKLGTRYPAVGQHVADVVVTLNDRGIRPYLLVDVTGVGRPVLDIIEPKLAKTDVYVSAVTFTGGDKLHGHLGSPEISMPKQLLVSRLQALMQTSRLRMPDNERIHALAEELRTYEVRVSEQTTNLTAGAFKVGAHDDMATALGLAVLFDPSKEQVRYFPAPYS